MILSQLTTDRTMILFFLDFSKTIDRFLHERIIQEKRLSIKRRKKAGDRTEP